MSAVPTTAPAVPAPTPADRGFTLPCPHCGEAAANIALHLDGLSFNCRECDVEITREEINDFVTSWTKVLAWVDQVPTF